MNSQPAGESIESNLPQWVRELWDSGVLKEPQGVHLLMTRLEGEGRTPEQALRAIVGWLSLLIFAGNDRVGREQSLRLWQEVSYLCWRHNHSLSSILLDRDSSSLA
jgi:hypothetical protein